MIVGLVLGGVLLVGFGGWLLFGGSSPENPEESSTELASSSQPKLSTSDESTAARDVVERHENVVEQNSLTDKEKLTEQHTAEPEPHGQLKSHQPTGIVSENRFAEGRGDCGVVLREEDLFRGCFIFSAGRGCVCGIVKVFPQEGHFAFFPACSSFTWNDLPHWQETGMLMDQSAHW